jgi:preprotein translocase SecE subunit
MKGVLCSYYKKAPRKGFLNNKISKTMSLITYLKDTQGELKHVSWPTRNQAIAFTIVVVLISIFVSFFLGFFDYIFSLILGKFVV